MRRVTLTPLTLSLAASLAMLAPAAFAQAPGECSSGFCGTPDMSGGGGGGGGGGAILIANTDLGETYSTSDDFDEDGFEDDLDNCPFKANTGQIDRDGDAVGDVCDNAPNLPNVDQLDTDGDGIGDVADLDIDGDDLQNDVDNCVRVPNPTQRDTNNDAEGDACDNDDDGDGFLDVEDQCPKLPGQLDPSTEGCRGDEDLDNISDAFDNCPGVANPGQENRDGDLLGDACDVDIDDDGVLNNLDNAPYDINPDQLDSDRDGLGDVADNDPCYVYRRDQPDKCLDLRDTFRVGGAAVGTGTALDVGMPLKLVIFANRIDVPMTYTWVVTSRPDGSAAAIDNARGKVVSSVGGYEYKYQRSGFVAPELMPDLPGEYEVTLEAQLVFDDEEFPGATRVAKSSFALTVGGEAASGCSTTEGDLSYPMTFALMFGAMFLGRRRRQR